MKKKFVECMPGTMNQDPDQWIQGLELKERKVERLDQKMSEVDLIIHILHNFPVEYETTLELLEDGPANEVATLDTAKEKLRTKFIRLNKDKHQGDNALFSRDRNQNYKGICTYCGIHGHKGSKCRKRLSKKVQMEERFMCQILHSFSGL
jgi:hypothetical protein